MKKILLIAATLVGVFTSCARKDEFKLTATHLPAELNGSFGYIYTNYEELVDSVQIAKGALTYTSTAETLDEVFVLKIVDYPIYFVKEAGELQIDFAIEDGSDPELKMIKGSESSIYKQIEAMNAELKGDTATSNEIAKKYFEANRDNFVGLQAFRKINFQNDAEFVATYESAGDIIKNFPGNKREYDRIFAAEATQVGAQFVDVEMVNGVGETVLLSSFRQEGKYLLVDFFASWCGPCIASMPALKELVRTFTPKGLAVVSIGVFDRLEEYNLAIEEHGITWANLIDTSDKSAEAYGIIGVPTFFLFSPEGEILVRTFGTHGIDGVKAKLTELVKQ